jgi:hypothetical protein
MTAFVAISCLAFGAVFGFIVCSVLSANGDDEE